MTWLLAFDFDGTLVADGTNEVPTETLLALEALREAGFLLAVITGRDRIPPASAPALRPLLHAFVGNNGGHIEIGEQKRELHLEESELFSILAHELEGASVLAFGRETIYLASSPEQPVPEWLQARPHAHISERQDDPIQKVIFYHDDVVRWRDRLRESHPHLILTGAQEPYSFFMTVTPKGADKGAALSLVAQELGVPLERTVAFGDSDNDLTMLGLAGRAVQVGDLPLLREVAGVQVASHSELGAYLRSLKVELQKG